MSGDLAAKVAEQRRSLPLKPFVRHAAAMLDPSVTQVLFNFSLQPVAYINNALRPTLRGGTVALSAMLGCACACPALL